MSTIPECLRKLGVRELSDEEYKEYCKVDPKYAYEDECKSENSSEDE